MARTLQTTARDRRKRAVPEGKRDVVSMPALFPYWSNTALRLALGAAVLGVVAAPAGLMAYVRSPWNTEQFQAVDQPVEFDHRHHVSDDHIDCLYCHSGAETSRAAGVPATEVCMGCHAQIWDNSPLLENVRRSYFSGEPLPWNRVHDLGDFAYFDHAVHVQRGLGCVACHGRVDQMARVEKIAPLSMQWCLDCHRRYETALLEHGAGSTEALSAWLNEDPMPRPAAQGAGASAHDESPPAYEPMHGQTFEVSARDELVRRGSVSSLTTCSACHR
jgi:hypothetical protein